MHYFFWKWYWADSTHSLATTPQHKYVNSFSHLYLCCMQFVWCLWIINNVVWVLWHKNQKKKTENFSAKMIWSQSVAGLWQILFVAYSYSNVFRLAKCLLPKSELWSIISFENFAEKDEFTKLILFLIHECTWNAFQLTPTVFSAKTFKWRLLLNIA